MTDFMYTSRLDWSKQEIRLIEILPEGCSSISSLELRLQHVSLRDAPKYTALSYAWGDQALKKLVLIDGKNFQITVNLEAALQEILHEQKDYMSSPILFWIDQLSIHQNDDLEKIDQVRNMDTIYKQADEVLIWLGEADMDTNMVFSELKQFASLAKEVGIKDYMTVIDHRGNALDEVIVSLVRPNKIFRADTWHAIYSLFRRQWWQRVWVVQEVTLARSARMACGSHRIEWVDIIRFLATVELFCTRISHLPLGDISDHKEVVWRIIEICARIGPFLQLPSVINMSLFIILGIDNVSSGQVATDPRDQVYSRLALMGESDRARITVRYDSAWTCRELYAQVTEFMIQEKGLSILRCVEPDHSSASLDLPSWVLNLNDNNIYHSTPVRDALFSTCGAAAIKDFSLRVDSDLQVLHVQGGYIDSIKSILGIFPHGRLDVVGRPELNSQQRAFQHVEELRAWIDDFKTVLAVNHGVSSETDMEVYENAIWRTCVVDFFGETIPAQVQEGYKALVGQVKPPKEYEGDVKNWQLEQSIPFLRKLDIRGRTPFITSKGYLGLSRNPVTVDGSVHIIQGARVPFVFHKKENGQFELKSDAYVHGIMYGEIFEDTENLDNWSPMEIC